MSPPPADSGKFPAIVVPTIRHSSLERVTVGRERLGVGLENPLDLSQSRAGDCVPQFLVHLRPFVGELVLKITA